MRKAATAAEAGICGILALLLLTLTVARNSVWTSDVTLMEDVVRKSPGKARVISMLADAYHGAGMFENAIAAYQYAIAADPSWSFLHYNNLGTIYHDLGKYDIAIGYFEQILRYDAAEPNAYLNLGHTYGVQGKSRLALEYYTKAINARPDFAKPYLARANLYLRTGATTSARQDYETACRLRAEDACDRLRNLIEEQGTTP